MRNWLPPIFQIVTKGRIIDSKGLASPQIDIIILKPEYPKALLDKKLYLAGGVLAVFECKITLKPTHLSKFFKTSAAIKSMAPLKSYRNIYEESFNPIYVGLLAHSHNWSKSNVVEKIGDAVFKNDLKYISKPIEMPDLLCVADACCWVAKKFLAPQLNPMNISMGECILTAYMSEQQIDPIREHKENISIPIATALKSMLHRISNEHEGLRSLALYFHNAMVETGGGPLRFWSIKDVFSEHNQKQYRLIGKSPNYYFPKYFKNI